MIRLVAFLGNYGREYENTRHNAGWLFADSLAFAANLRWQSKFKGMISDFSPEQLSQWACDKKICSKKDGSPVIVPDDAPAHIYFLKPMTYMNLSGESIIEAANFYKITAEEILVVHDELELPFGFVSLKWSGGLGGHNGLRSTKNVLGTADFWRIRFGIGRPSNDRISIADYVLSRFSSDEEERLMDVFAQSALLFVRLLLSPEPQRLLQAWGKKNLLAD